MRTLLLVESHAATRRHLSEMLAQSGYHVVEAATPEIALERFNTGGPDAVILAADFPLLEGQPLPALLTSHSLRPPPPLLVIDKKHLGRARGRQAVLAWKPHGYVEDPLKEDELKEKIAALWEPATTGSALEGAALILSRPPVQSGEVKSASLAQQLCSLYQLRRSGVFVLARAGVVSHAYYWEGAPVAFATSDLDTSWAVFAKNRGIPSPASGAMWPLRSLPFAEDVAPGGSAAAAWQEYVQASVARLIGERSGRFAFFAGDELGPVIPRAAVAALLPILEGARSSFTTQRFGKVLKPHLGEFPARTTTFSQEVNALGLDPADMKVAMQINGRLPLRDLLAHGRGSLRQGYSLFWFLQVTGAVSFEAAPAAASGDPAMEAESLPRKRRKPVPPELAAQLREGALRIITGSYYKALGVELSVDSDAVENVYREVAAKFHPDTYAELDTEPLRDLLESVQEKLAAAYKVLSVDDKRRAYLKFLFSRAALSRVPPVNVDAEIALRRAESHVRRGDFRSALQGFEEAVELNPKEPEYGVYLAWYTYRHDSGDVPARAKAAQKILKRALAAQPTSERAQIVQAIVEADAGDAASARKRILRILETRPESVLAKSALRYLSR